jgi:enoyl-CoA hydratase
MVRIDWETPAIMVITLDRPDRRNALDLPSLVAIDDALTEASRQRARVVVLTGAPPAFCAGADIDGVESEQFTATLLALLHRFSELPIAVIGAIDGAALGAGTQLASVCDLRVATSRSRFGVPAANLGLAVDQWTAHRIASQFTGPIARAMLLAAEVYDGERLHSAGVIHRIGGLPEALTWAREIAGLAPLTIAAHKLALERNATAPDRDADVSAARAAAWSSSDAIEGRTAFQQKRAPRFVGR